MASNDLSSLGYIDDKVLECSICNGRLEDPKSLGCLHSFCLKCLENWVCTNRGKLTCPICRKPHPIPEGGLQQLAPNTFLNNLLETIKLEKKKDEVQCICESTEQVTNYCKECRHYMCLTCSNHHKMLPITSTHKLLAVEEVQSMTQQQFSLLNPPLCPSHAKPLEMYCTKCKVPICIQCAVIQHTADGKHKLIDIITAFNTFKETSEDLKKAASESIKKTENLLKVVEKNAIKLEESKDASLRDIDNKVQEMVQVIQKKADEMKKKVEMIYKNAKKVNDVQMKNLETINSELNINLSFLKKLLTSEPATAMKSSEIVLNKMMDTINNSEEIKQNGCRQINFIRNKHSIDSLKKNDFGKVTIKPLTIKVDGKPTGVAKGDGDCLLVSFCTNEIYKYKQSGERIGKITLPKRVMVKCMYRMKNGNIAFSDQGNKSIQVCDTNRLVLKSIGKGVFITPCGIHIDEATNVIYVADPDIGCVLMFDINSGKKLEEIEPEDKSYTEYLDVTLTKTKKVLVADAGRRQVLLYDKDKSLKVFINERDYNMVIMPGGIVVDEDDNIIIATRDKIQLFRSDGHFIKRIDQQEDGITVADQLCIISHNPRMVAVSCYGDSTIKIIYY
ncbi:uncharacterized protein [Antedon mediterranea]|uniref:uncharacterized protein n=1 Tax=Antedon mediterranea TaxID=105859 RepID=UPI003AF910E4